MIDLLSIIFNDIWVWDNLDLNTTDPLKSSPKTVSEVILLCVTDTILTVSYSDLQAIVVVWHPLLQSHLTVCWTNYGLSPAVIFGRKIKRLHESYESVSVFSFCRHATSCVHH